MEEIDLEVGWPPTLNNYYTHTRRGVFIRARGRQYRLAVAEDLQEQIGVLVCIDEPVFVSAILYPPDRRARDLDNYMKAPLDALTHNGFWNDDKLVHQLLLYKGQITSGGKIKLHIGDAWPIVDHSLNPLDLL